VAHNFNKQKDPLRPLTTLLMSSSTPPSSTSSSSSVFASGFTARDFPSATDKVIEISASDSVQVGFRTLITNNILSVPVYDEQGKTYLGFFDISDAIRFSTMDGVKVDSRPIGEMIRQLSNHEHFAPWIACALDDGISKILDILKTKAKRVPIIESGKCVKIISQSAVAKYVSDWLNTPAAQPLPIQFSQLAKDSGLALKSVVTLSEEALAKDAFALLIEKNLSAIGILDDENQLLTCVTAKDIRLVPQIESHGETTAAELLQLPVVDFVSKSRMVFEKMGKARPAIVVVHDDTPVHVIVHKLAKTHMHRVFIVNSETKTPSGVFTVGDVVRLL